MVKLAPVFVAAAWVLSGAGCTANPERARVAFEHATPCCSGLSELSYRPLALDAVGRYDIDDKSPLFVFDTGRSFVLPLALPMHGTPYVIELRSYVLGDQPQTGQVFYPVALVLDEQHRVLSRHETEGLAIARASHQEAIDENRWGLPLRLELDIVVDDPAARYLVIHTTARQLGATSTATVKTVVPVIVPGLVTALPGGEEQVTIVHSPFGCVAVGVRR